MDNRYYQFFELYENEEYFEAHEILEDIWVDETNCNTKKHPAVVLIQFSVALLHWKRSNFKGASKVMRSSLNHLKDLETQIDQVGVNSQILKKIMMETIPLIEEEEKYKKILLPKYY